MCHVELGPSQIAPRQAGPAESCLRYGLVDVNTGSYLPLTLVLGQVDLFEHLRPLFHHQGLLVGVGGDVAVVL